jgi:SOS-response transcriptional repressor LexA
LSVCTQKQRVVLDFISEFTDSKGYAPTFQEIANGVGLKSLATVHKHLTNLQNLGFLKRGANKARTVEVTDPDALEGRFRFEGKDRLWDNVAGCYWTREAM